MTASSDPQSASPAREVEPVETVQSDTDPGARVVDHDVDDAGPVDVEHAAESDETRSADFRSESDLNRSALVGLVVIGVLVVLAVIGVGLTLSNTSNLPPPPPIIEQNAPSPPPSP